MALQRFEPIRRGVAIICMALAVMLSGQSYISLMDRIEHAQHHVHFANPLAGGVEFCGDVHDACGDHHERDSHHLADNHPPHNPADHQHSDAAIVFLAAQSFVLAICAVPAPRCESEPPALVSFFPRGPDHPPKPGLEIRA